MASLEVLACDRNFLLFCELPHGRNVNSGVRSTHHKWAVLLQSCISVAHRWCDVGSVVGLHCGFESGNCSVILHVGGNVDFSRSSPEHNNAVNTSCLLEVANVFAHLLHHVPAVFALLHVVAVEAFCIVLVESGLDRNDFLEFVFNWLDVLWLENVCVACALIGVGRINVPCAKHYVVQISDRNDVFVVQIFFRIGRYADFVILGH